MYEQDEWQKAFEEANIWGFDRTDVTEQGSELALAVVDAYESEKGDENEFVVQAVIDAAGRQFETWGIEEFKEVMASYVGSELGDNSGTDHATFRIFDENFGETFTFNRIRP